jgi:hypothetical protein
VVAECQGDQPGNRGRTKQQGNDGETTDSSAESSLEAEELEEVDEDEEEEEEEEEEEDDDAHKWSDWNVILEQERDNEMYSEGGGWKKIFQVVAWDGDQGLNGTVKYRLKYGVSTGDHHHGHNGGKNAAAPPAGTDEVYSMNGVTGEIFTSATRIKPETMLKFIIEASDGGHPEPKITQTMLMLRTKAVNRRGLAAERLKGFRSRSLFTHSFIYSGLKS